MTTMREDVEALNELVKFFGWRRAAELMGLAIVYSLRGVTPDELGTRPSDSTGERFRRDVRRFARFLNESGKGHLLVDGDETETIAAIARGGGFAA